MSEILQKMTEEVSSDKHPLEKLIRKHAQPDGVHATLIPSLFLIRESEVREPVARVNEISFCLIIQGEKVVWLGEQRFRYGPGHYVVASVELPVTGQIVRASPDLPYLAYKIEFTSVEVLEVMNDANLKPTRDKKAKRAILWAMWKHLCWMRQSGSAACWINRSIFPSWRLFLKRSCYTGFCKGRTVIH